MSDDNDGVQWNIVITPEPQEIRVGVNLEGMEYSNWPITNFILKELATPGINELKSKLQHPEIIFIKFMRDAWQVQSRPHIIEEYINGKETPMSEMGSELWTSTLTEALEHTGV